MDLPQDNTLSFMPSALELLQRAVKRNLEEPAPGSAGRLDAFTADAQALQEAQRSGKALPPFHLQVRTGTNVAELHLTGVGSVKVVQTADRKEVAVVGDCLHGHLQGGMVKVAATRTGGASYETERMKWAGDDAALASRAIDAALRGLLTKGAFDRAMRSGLINDAWQAADKALARDKAAGEGLRGEMPSMGRTGRPGFQVPVALIDGSAAQQLRTPAIYLARKEDFEVFALPRTEVLVLVPCEAVAGRLPEPGLRAILSTDENGRVVSTPCSRAQARSELSSKDLLAMTASQEKQVGAVLAAVDQVVSKGVQPEQARQSTPGFPGTVTAADLGALADQAAQLGVRAQGPGPDPLQRSGASWLGHPLYLAAEALVENSLPAPRTPFQLAHRLEKMLGSDSLLAGIKDGVQFTETGSRHVNVPVQQVAKAKERETQVQR